MPKRTSTPKLDTVQNARRVVLQSVGETVPVPADTAPTASEAAIISRIMAEMGRKGGRIGGKRRLVTMTKAERSDVASNAAKARWKAVKKKAKPKLH